MLPGMRVVLSETSVFPLGEEVQNGAVTLPDAVLQVAWRRLIAAFHKVAIALAAPGGQHGE